MNPVRRFFVLFAICSAGLSCLSPMRCSAQAADYDDARFTYQVQVEKISIESDKKRAQLFDQYAGAVDRLQAGFQQRGDLENAIAAKAEAESARSGRKTGDNEFSGVGALREKLIAAGDRITASQEQAIAAVEEKWAMALKGFREQFTKAGDLDNALKIDKEIAALAGAAASPPPSATETPGGAVGTVPQMVDTVVADSPMSEKDPLLGEIVLRPGRHRNDETVVGQLTAERGAGNTGILTIPEGTHVRSGSLFLRTGKINATGSIFEKVEISEDAWGRFTARRCLFDDCAFRKGGSWHHEFFSAKFSFEDCVFNDGFFSSWNMKSVGIKATNCTFVDIKFPDHPYKDDAGTEALAEWRTFERCRFVDCEIPQGLLMATKDCVFENCRIRKDKEDLLIDAPLAVTLYSAGELLSVGRPLSEKVAFEIKDAADLPGDVGARVPYVIKNGKLTFPR